VLGLRRDVVRLGAVFSQPAHKSGAVSLPSSARLDSDSVIEKRSEWFFWTLPGAMAVGLSVLVQWSPGAHHHLVQLSFIPAAVRLEVGLLLVSSPLLWAALLLVLAAVRWWRGGRVLPPLAGLLFSAVALWAWAEVMLGVPRWVKTAAAPALDSLERWRAEHGRYPRVDLGDPGFPSELREVIKAAGCRRYELQGPSFALTCADCYYSAETQTWSAD